MLEHNPLESFSYCPRCGKEGFGNLSDRAKHCGACGLTYFHNVAAAVACFVRDTSGQYLFVRRANEPARGTLDMAGGFIDPKETAEEAVERELREETGLEAKKIKYIDSAYNIYPYSEIDVYTCDLIFLVEVESFASAQASDDASELIVTSLEKLRGEDFGLDSIRRIMTEVLEHSPRFASLYD